MYRGRHADKAAVNSRVRKSGSKSRLLLLPIMLLVIAAVGGTVAYLLSQTQPVNNTFTPAHVSCEVTESFDGSVKTNVNVTNTGDTEAFLRVKLISYRVNAQGERIGGTAAIPPFTPGEGWAAYGGFYYYTAPVAAGEAPQADLIASLSLTGHYEDADGGRQVIEVLAEAIQSAPAEAVGTAWGVTISNGTVSAYQ